MKFNCVLNFDREIEAKDEEEAYDKFATDISNIDEYCEYINIDEIKEIKNENQ